jgi:hypothetical protein
MNHICAQHVDNFAEIGIIAGIKSIPANACIRTTGGCQDIGAAAGKRLAGLFDGYHLLMASICHPLL